MLALRFKGSGSECVQLGEMVNAHAIGCNLQTNPPNAFSGFLRKLPTPPIIADLSCRKMPKAPSFLSLCIKASSREPDHKVLLETLRRMPLKALKEELGKLGIKYADCYEKEELVRRLASAYDLSNKEKHVAESDNAIFRLPMKRLKGTIVSPKEYILIPLTIGNQGPFNFLLDTGSSTTIISPTIAYDKLRIQQNSGKISYGIGGTGRPLYGTKAIKLPPIKIMGHLCEPAEALVMDISGTRLDSEVAGLVGMNILSQFDVEFDFVSQMILFYASAATKKYQGLVHGLQNLATTTANFGIPSVQVKVGKAPPQAAILDFGSSQNVCSIDVALDSGKGGYLGRLWRWWCPDDVLFCRDGCPNSDKKRRKSPTITEIQQCEVRSWQFTSHDSSRCKDHFGSDFIYTFQSHYFNIN